MPGKIKSEEIHRVPYSDLLKRGQHHHRQSDYKIVFSTHWEKAEDFVSENEAG